MTPTAASARASAASKSSMRCSRARSSMMARIAALENSGVEQRRRDAAGRSWRAVAATHISGPCAPAANPQIAIRSARPLASRAVRRQALRLDAVVEGMAARPRCPVCCSGQGVMPMAMTMTGEVAAGRAARGGLGEAQRSGGAEGLHPRLRDAGHDRRQRIPGGRDQQDRAGQGALQRQGDG